MSSEMRRADDEIIAGSQLRRLIGKTGRFVGLQGSWTLV
jgi:hypothetical protein